MEQEFKDILRVQGVKAKGFGIIPKLIMLDSNLTIEAKAIYSYFCSYAGAGTVAFPSRDKICEDLQISKTRYYKHFNLLKKYGYIKVEQVVHENKTFSHNIYTLCEHPEPVNDEPPCPNFKDTDKEPCPSFKDTEPCPNFKDTINNNLFFNNNNINNKYISVSQSNIDTEYLEKNKNFQQTDRLNQESFDEEFYQDITEQIFVDGFDEKDREFINSAVVYLLTKGVRKLPVRVVKERICSLNYPIVLNELKKFKEVLEQEKIRAPVPYFASCLFEAAAKYSLESFTQGQLPTT